MLGSTCYHLCWIATYFVYLWLIQSVYHVTVSYCTNIVSLTRIFRFRKDICDYKAHTFNCSFYSLSLFPTGERPFSCPHCNRAFADRSNLRAHLQTHADVKKYQCSTCSRTFSRMSLLQKHSTAGCSPSTAWTRHFVFNFGHGALWDNNDSALLLSTPTHRCNMRQEKDDMKFQQIS